MPKKAVWVKKSSFNATKILSQQGNISKMKNRTIRALNKLDLQLEEVIQWLENQDERVLAKSPEPGAWSVLQVLGHLLQTEIVSFNYIRKKSASGLEDLPKEGWRSTWRGFRLWIFLQAPIRVKAPQIVDVSAQEVGTRADLIAAFRTLRRDIRLFLEGLAAAGFEVSVFRHPFVGQMRLLETLRFLQDHFDRHIRQMRRTLNALS